MGDAMGRDDKGELVDLLVHRAFYPVLMAQRVGPNKAIIENLQNATRNKIERFRGYKAVEDVMINFRRDLISERSMDFYSDLKSLNLPLLNDVREDFERKARELGFDPDTLLTAPFAFDKEP